jgi:hypothetical protein
MTRENGRGDSERWMKLADENGAVTWLDLQSGEIVSDPRRPAETGALRTLVVPALEKRGWRWKALNENTAVLHVECERGCYQLVLITSEEYYLLSCCCILPSRVREATRGAVLDLLNRINWGLATGRFELDPARGQVRFRVALYAENLTPTETTVDRMIDRALSTVDRCYDLVLQVERGETTPQAAAGEVRARAQASLERERRG